MGNKPVLHCPEHVSSLREVVLPKVPAGHGVGIVDNAKQ